MTSLYERADHFGLNIPETRKFVQQIFLEENWLRKLIFGMNLFLAKIIHDSTCLINLYQLVSSGENK